MSRHNNIKKQIDYYSRRLQKLNEQLAQEGRSADPKILIEIEDIEKQIEKLEISLKESTPKDTSITPDETPGTPQNDGKSWLIRIILIAAFLSLVVVIIPLFSKEQQFESSRTPITESISTPVPTNTPVPNTSTPVPTNTPIPNTSTPVPTNTSTSAPNYLIICQKYSPSTIEERIQCEGNDQVCDEGIAACEIAFSQDSNSWEVLDILTFLRSGRTGWNPPPSLDEDIAGIIKYHDDIMRFSQDKRGCNMLVRLGEAYRLKDPPDEENAKLPLETYLNNQCNTLNERVQCNLRGEAVQVCRR